MKQFNMKKRRYIQNDGQKVQRNRKRDREQYVIEITYVTNKNIELVSIPSFLLDILKIHTSYLINDKLQ